MIKIGMHEFCLETGGTLLSGATVAAVEDRVWDAWYCVRTYARREHIAAAQLRRYSDIEVFLPCIRYERPLRSTRVWTTEALFQNYLFARFDLAACGRKIRHAHAVRDVVHFGTRFPIIPEMVIEELRSAMGQEETRVIVSSFDPGEEVRIAGGPFHDLEAVVIRAMPSQQRVAVLLDFLGRQTKVEIDDTQLTPVVERSRRADVVCSAAPLGQENERTRLSSRCPVSQPAN
jgi:transcriptional antiterminator RfaH